MENLRNEGLEKNTVLVGDVMLDATHMFYKRAMTHCPLESLTSHRLGTYILATVHRPSNTDIKEHLQSIFDAFGQLAVPVILPLHPRTKAALSGITVPANVEIRPPVSYLAMLTLTCNAYRVLTDSGGLQKEAYWFGVPCVILREETEYPETFENNWSICAGANQETIVRAVSGGPTGPQCQLGEGPEGRASAMIARSLLSGS